MYFKREIKILKQIVCDKSLGKGQAYHNELKEIEARSRDQVLRIAVIGEFNAGKSTFINALMRHRILKEGALPTTASATHIRSGSKSIRAVFTDGKIITSFEKARDYLKKRFKIQDSNEWKSVIAALTAEPNVARFVKHLNLCIPKQKGSLWEALKNLFRSSNQHVFDGEKRGGLPSYVELIDTPGFNPGASDAANHFDVTLEVVDNYADMAIVLIPAHAAMSASLLSFLENHLSQYISRCIFVITKIDNHTEQEKQSVIQLVADVLNERFGLTCPIIYTIAARTVLPVKRMPPELAEEWKIHQSNFCSFEHNIWKKLYESRQLVIRSSLARFLESISSQIKSDFGKRIDYVKKLKEATSKNKLREIKSLTTEICNKGISELNDFCDSRHPLIEQDLKAKKMEVLSIIWNIIQKGDKLNNFDTEEKPKIITAVETGLKEANKKLQNRQGEINKKYESLILKFQNNFKHHYENLKALSPNKIDNLNYQIKGQKYKGKTVDAVFEGNEMAAGGGALVGGVVGQLLIPIPGVGAVIGAGLGYLFGGWLMNTFGPPASVIQKKAYDSVKIEVDKIFLDFTEKSKVMITEFKQNCSSSLISYADSHVKKYNKVVNSIRKECAVQCSRYENDIKRMSKINQILDEMKENFEDYIK